MIFIKHNEDQGKSASSDLFNMGILNIQIDRYYDEIVVGVSNRFIQQHYSAEFYSVGTNIKMELFSSSAKSSSISVS